jgi:hypothetical protein
LAVVSFPLYETWGGACPWGRREEGQNAACRRELDLDGGGLGSDLVDLTKTLRVKSTKNRVQGLRIKRVASKPLNLYFSKQVTYFLNKIYRIMDKSSLLSVPSGAHNWPYLLELRVPQDRIFVRFSKFEGTPAREICKGSSPPFPQFEWHNLGKTTWIDAEVLY